MSILVPHERPSHRHTAPWTIGSIDLDSPGGTMRTRPAAITTIVIAIGLALTTVGIARQLPYTFGGHGDLSTVAADVWAHGTAISPSLVALIFLGIFATIAMRPTRGGRRAATWLAVLAIAMIVSGVAEPLQQQAILFQTIDVVGVGIWALHVTLIALVLSAIGEARRRAVEPEVSSRGPASLAAAAA
jgi:hypothetical protein